MGDLTLREALASNRLEAFVRQEEARGVELAHGSDLERALALLIAQPDQNSFNTDVPFRSMNGRAIWSSQAATFARSILSPVISPS